MRIFLILWILVFSTTLAAPGWSLTQSNKIIRKNSNVEIAVHYPLIGQAVIDADLAQWATALVQDFEDNDDTDERQFRPFILKVSNKVERPSARAVSVMFTVIRYTGGMHESRDIFVRSYDMQTGKPLTLGQVFEDTKNAIQIMSTYCETALRRTLGEAADEYMLKEGTRPDADNFANIALRPQGIRVYFQPYQVAPWYLGPQTVDMPLSALADAKPVLAWWGRKTK